MLRQTLRAMGIGFWSLLSLDIFIRFIDYYARWGLLAKFMANHPHIAAVAHTPVV